MFPPWEISLVPKHKDAFDIEVTIQPTLQKWILQVVFINTVSIKSHFPGIMSRHLGVDLILTSSILRQSNTQLKVYIAYKASG